MAYGKAVLVGALLLAGTPAFAQRSTKQPPISSTLATLQVDDAGKLIGAKNVMIHDTAYNVSFLTGSCSTIFGDCSTSHFDFQTEQQANDAAQALLTQVFVNQNASDRAFNYSPYQVFGCGGYDSYRCSSLIAYGTDQSQMLASAAVNNRFNTGDSVWGAQRYDASYSTEASGSLNFARFTRVAVAAVPEPATWAMMLVGFGMVAGAARYRRRATNAAIV